MLADGSRRQRQYHDFFNYAGLHRSVWLSTTPRAHIDDVTVTTDIDQGAGVVRYAVGAVDADGMTVRVLLRDAEGREVAAAEGADGSLRVDNPALWGPGHGYLYDLQVELIDGDAVVDAYPLPVGIRTVRVEGTQFLINGEPFYFRGFGKHEDLNVHGRGHDDAAMLHDFSLLAWIGANSFRTSHYPYAEEVLEQADRQGIVVIDETAAVGLNLGVGGGMFLGGPRTTYSDETISAATQAVHRRAIEELIARDKNHPCVVLWSLANEPESHTDAGRTYFEPLFAAAREADPSRPVGFVNMMFALPDTCTVTELADVVMINRYYGWYVEPGDLEAAERGLEAELQAWATTHGKPIIVTEYGADTMSGLHTDGRQHLERGIPGRAARDVPPRLRPHGGGGGRARLELRRLRDGALLHACRRQQEGRVHPGQAAENGRTRPATPLARRYLTRAVECLTTSSPKSSRLAGPSPSMGSGDRTDLCASAS